MRKYKKAFSLIELMITIVVTAVLLGLAAPGFQTMMENTRVLAKSENLATALEYARAEALRRKVRVSVCASSDAEQCGNDWNAGFIVLVDGAASDLAAAAVVGSPADVLQVWEPSGTNTNITVSDAKQFVRFLPTGLIANVNGNAVTMRVSYPGCVGAGVARIVSVGISGTVDVVRADCP